MLMNISNTLPFPLASIGSLVINTQLHLIYSNNLCGASERYGFWERPTVIILTNSRGHSSGRRDENEISSRGQNRWTDRTESFTDEPLSRFQTPTCCSAVDVQHVPDMFDVFMCTSNQTCHYINSKSRRGRIILHILHKQNQMRQWRSSPFTAQPLFALKQVRTVCRHQLSITL